MADTIITNSPERRSSDEGAGWLVALVIVIAIIVGGVFLYRSGFFWSANSQPADDNDTNINVSIPTPNTGGGNEQPQDNQPQ